MEYIGALIAKYRKLSQSKTPEDLADIISQDIAKAEAGGIPPMLRPTATSKVNKPKDEK